MKADIILDEHYGLWEVWTTDEDGNREVECFRRYEDAESYYDVRLTKGTVKGGHMRNCAT